MSYYNQNQPPVGVPPPQGYPPEGDSRGGRFGGESSGFGSGRCGGYGDCFRYLFLFSDTERDFEQIAALASNMGLYSQVYTKVVVVSKLPLPNYRFDLDDKRPQREESPEGKKLMEFRKSLPAYKEKGAILSAILQNQVVVISGETGCGMTTQIPQFILETEIDSMRGALCNIICTQPRKISAMSVSERIASERGEKLGETVGYKVRLEGVKGRDTHLLFCTTGILLRRLLIDRSLKGVTHIIVDEIHERGINEDFLLIVLRDLPRRPELRLVLMSATLDAELFSSYFGGAPMVQIPSFEEERIALINETRRKMIEGF